MDQLKPKREYRSVRRQEQARQTRLRIIMAARMVFIERGYTGTSIDAIAQEAGVAVETAYAIFKNKRSILSALVDVSVVGDDLPVPLLDRPNIQATRQETDQRRLIHTFAADIGIIMGRMAPVFALLRSAAQTEPEIATMLDKLLKDRMHGMAYFVEQLARIGRLRDGLEAKQAAETVWAVSSAEVFQLFTTDLLWTNEQFINWLEDSLIQLLLPD